MKNILASLSDTLLAAITRKALTPEGKIIIDEDTVAFAYSPKGKRAQRIFIVDSDHDYMEVRGNRQEPQLANATAEEVFEGFPDILEVMDPRAYEALASCDKADDLDD